MPGDENATRELHELRAEVAASRTEVAELRQDIQDLLAAWRAATGIVRAVKWAGKIATALTALYALYRIGGPGK